MRFFSLRQSSRAVLLFMGLSGGLMLNVQAQAATDNAVRANANSNTNARASATTSADGIVAVVNDNTILKSELLNAFNQTRARAEAAGEPVNNAQLQAEVLDALIMRELQLSLINRIGLKPDEEAINQRLAQIAKAEGLSSIQALQQSMDRAQPGSYAGLRKKLMEDATIQALQQRQVSRRVRITDQDIDAFLSSPEAKRLDQSEYQTIHVRVPYIDDYSRLSDSQRAEALKVATALRNELQAPNANIDSIVTQAQARYQLPIQGGNMGYHKAANLPTALADQITQLPIGGVSEPMITPEGIDIIKLADKKDASNMIVPQWHVRHILVKVDALQNSAMAEQKINDLYDQLRQGADFADLAATYSDDPGSAGRGGDLEWVNEGDMVAPFEAAMKNTAVGDYSAPFKTDFGWHILQVEDTRQQDVSDDYRRNLAQQALYQRLAPQAKDDWLQELRSGAYIQIMQ